MTTLEQAFDVFLLTSTYITGGITIFLITVTAKNRGVVQISVPLVCLLSVYNIAGLSLGVSIYFLYLLIKLRLMGYSEKDRLFDI